MTFDPFLKNTIRSKCHPRLGGKYSHGFLTRAKCSAGPEFSSTGSVLDLFNFQIMLKYFLLVEMFLAEYPPSVYYYTWYLDLNCDYGKLSFDILQFPKHVGTVTNQSDLHSEHWLQQPPRWSKNLRMWQRWAGNTLQDQLWWPAQSLLWLIMFYIRIMF